MRTILFLLVGVISAMSQSAFADGEGTAPKSRNKRPAIEITPKVEADVLKFVQTHHPELADLLGFLEAARPDQYKRAIRDLERSRNRLTIIGERDRPRYQLELKTWVLQSEIRLAVAKLQMNNSQALREELRRLLKQQADLKISLLKQDRERARDRLKKIDELITRSVESRDQSIERQWRLLTKTKNVNVNAGAKSNVAGTKKSAKDQNPQTKGN